MNEIIFLLGLISGAIALRVLQDWYRQLKTFEVGEVSIDPKPSKLLFFPDEKMPCNSYCNKLIGRAGVNCPWRNKCEYYHLRDKERSSLMQLMESLASARTIDLCMYRFTLQQLSNLLIYLHQRGTRVRIITDASREPIEGNQIPRLRESGIEVRENALPADIGGDHRDNLMHNKYVIIDSKYCYLGSFNWTKAGVTRHHETLIKNYEPNVVRPLARKFEQMWSEMTSQELMLLYYSF